MFKYAIRFGFTDFNYSESNYKEVILKFNLPCRVDLSKLLSPTESFLRLLIAESGYNPDTYRLCYFWCGVGQETLHVIVGGRK